ncbi:hypothetical protein WJX75_002808 [Coccomyxa subellipsoidea]|uniref:GATA-type domain-containing protein n=1 Tax=Coccomyxa subellipsoidea TaxID=248742 RepID=A0ABR2Z3P6_9CHLO
MRTDFHKNHSKADELEDVCRPCKALRDANRRALRASMMPNVSQKTCKKCQVEKPAEEFPRNKLTSDGLHSYCKKCKLALDTISREKRKRQDGSAYTPRGPIAAPDVLRQQLQQEGGMASPEQMPMPESLLCDSCKEYQPISSMAEDPNMPGILRCLACRTALAAYGQQQMENQQEGGQAAEGAVQAADAQQYAAAMAASSGLAPPEAAPMHPGMTEAYQLPVPDAAAYGAAQMQHAAPLSTAMGAPVSALQGTAEPDAAALTALLVDPSLSEPLQVVPQKVCHGCAVEKQAQHFMPDRRSKDGLMNYCRACCLAGAHTAAVIPRRPGRPPRAAALIPLTHKQCRKCSETKLAEEFPQKKSHPDGRDDYCKACHARATAARVAARGPVKEPTVDAKQCSKCHEQKPAAEFHRDCNKPDGLRGRCRTCEAAAGQVRRQSRHKTLEPTVDSKLCRRCNIEKSADDFPRKKERSDGLDSYCKVCNCAATAQRVQRKGPVPGIASKACPRCGEEKPTTEFSTRRTVDGLHAYCRSCKEATGTSRGLSPPPKQGEKEDMEAAASAAIQRAEAAAAVEASLAASAGSAPQEGAQHQTVPGWAGALDAEQAANQHAAWVQMLAPQMGVPVGGDQQQQQQLMHLQQLQQQAMIQHMQPPQQLQPVMLQEVPPGEPHMQEQAPAQPPAQQQEQLPEQQQLAQQQMEMQEQQPAA